jgi:hypothetical protein
VCDSIAGLALGGQVASGSYGRVFRGTYFGSKVCDQVSRGVRVWWLASWSGDVRADLQLPGPPHSLTRNTPQVAVKVLDGPDVLRREPATGLSLEALLGAGLKHPALVATLAWAVVAGKVRVAGWMCVCVGGESRLMPRGSLPHPCVVSSHCVNGATVSLTHTQGQLPARVQVWGHTLDPR